MENQTHITDSVFSRIEKILNKVLELDPHTGESLSELAGNVFLIDVAEANKKIFFYIDDGGCHLSTEHQDKLDVTIKGRPTALAGLLLNRKGGAGIFPKDLEIKGDINLAQRLQTIMQQMDIDWEEYLSQWTGDTVARKLTVAFTDFRHFVRQTGQSLSQNGSEYLRYEKEILPDDLLMKEFVEAVDELRNDVERIKQRIQRLEIDRT